MGSADQSWKTLQNVPNVSQKEKSVFVWRGGGAVDSLKHLHYSAPAFRGRRCKLVSANSES